MVVVEKPTQPVIEKQPPAASSHRPWWQTAGQVLVLGVAVIAGLELFFNLTGVGMEEILQPDPHFGTRHIPNKDVVWRMEGFSSGKLNSVGLRDEEHSLVKPPATYRIALIGDSSTEGLQVPLKDTYGSLLQRQFNSHGLCTEVINFACSAYSTGQEVLEFEQQAAQYKPDLTILFYNRGDAMENVRKPTDFSCEPRPYFYMDGNGRLAEDDRILSTYASALQPNPVVDWLRKNSRLFGVFSQTNLNLSIHEPLYRRIRGVLLQPFAPHVAKIKQENAPYPVQNAWQVTSALVERLNIDCKQTGSKFVVIGFPNIVDDPEFAQQIKGVGELAKKDGFGWLDLTPTFRWHPDPMSLFYQYHFSVKGHKVVAEQITKYLQSQGY